jgi:hypothetical protein
VTAVIRVHQLQCTDPRSEQFDGDVHVRGRLGDLDDLDDWPADDFELLARFEGRGVRQMACLPVEQMRGPVQRQASSHQFRLTDPGEPEGVSPRRVDPVTLNTLHRPAERVHQVHHVIEVVVPRRVGMVAFPAHSRSPSDGGVHHPGRHRQFLAVLNGARSVSSLLFPNGFDQSPVGTAEAVAPLASPGFLAPAAQQRRCHPQTAQPDSLVPLADAGPVQLPSRAPAGFAGVSCPGNVSGVR